jgi:hypothetical protein
MRCEMRSFTQEEYWNYSHAMFDVLLRYAIEQSNDPVIFFEFIGEYIKEHPYKEVSKIYEAVEDARQS